MGKTGSILSSGGTLLGVALAMVAGLKIAGSHDKTIADEIAGVSALLMVTAIALSYLSVRSDANTAEWEKRADGTFIAGLAGFVVAVGVLAFADLS